MGSQFYESAMHVLRSISRAVRRQPDSTAVEQPSYPRCTPAPAEQSSPFAPPPAALPAMSIEAHQSAIHFLTEHRPPAGREAEVRRLIQLHFSQCQADAGAANRGGELQFCRSRNCPHARNCAARPNQ